MSSKPLYQGNRPKPVSHPTYEGSVIKDSHLQTAFCQSLFALCFHFHLLRRGRSICFWFFTINSARWILFPFSPFLSISHSPYSPCHSLKNWFSNSEILTCQQSELKYRHTRFELKLLIRKIWIASKFGKMPCFLQIHKTAETQKWDKWCRPAISNAILI